jgi:hypothetical protein
MQMEWLDIEPQTSIVYNKCISTFLFYNLANYGYRPPDDGFMEIESCGNKYEMCWYEILWLTV